MSAFTRALSTNNYGPAKFIVDGTTVANGTHSTIQSAIDAASAGDTVFIRPGTYTENLTLKAGVDLTGYTSDGFSGHVIINGKCSFSAAGAVHISGLRLQTNSDFFLEVTGSASSAVALTNCSLNCLNNTGISYTSSGASSLVAIQYCNGDIGTTGISLFSSSSTGPIVINYSTIENSGDSTTASTISAGLLSITCSRIIFPITTSGTADIQAQDSTFSTLSNVTMITHGGSGGNSFVQRCMIASNSASAVSIGGTLTMSLNTINSSNTNAITGAGTLINAGQSFTGSSYLINTSTQTARQFDVGGISFDGGTNLLSIFQQGTFSPTIRGSSTAGTVTMSTQVGRYQKVGRMVSVNIVVDWSTIGTATGSAQCNNLPFTSANFSTAGNPSVCSSATNSLVTAAGGVPIFQVNSNTATGNINYYSGASSAGVAGTITATNGFSTISIYETA